MTVQELSKALSPMGYTVEDTDDVVRIVISPEDFIRGAPKLKFDLESVGWRRSYFVSGITTINQRGERDVGQVPASARLSGYGAGQAEAEETEADGTGRRICTAITVLGGGAE